MKCSVTGCNNTSRTKGITLHPFPNEPTVRSQWMFALRIENVDPTWKGAVCSKHFAYDDFIVMKRGGRGVKEDAVPTVNLTNSDFDSIPVVDVCRVCLATDTKMSTIYNNHLQKWFEQFTGITLFEREKLPHRLCFECVHCLMNCIKFQQKSVRANTLMYKLIENDGVLSYQNIHSIDRKSNQLTSSLNTTHFGVNYFDFIVTEFDDVKPIESPEEVKMDDTEYLEQDIKDEGNEGSNESNEFDNENEQTNDSTKIYVLEFDNDNSLNDEENNEDVANDNDYSTDDSLPLEAARTKKAKGTRKVRKKAKKDAEPKIDRRRKPLLNDNLSETLFTIQDLTIEEQLADIEKRQESANYKNSPFKCTECFKGFSDQDAYSSHMSRHTDECGEYKCNVCKIHFKQPNALRKHITAHHTQRFSCNQCSYTTTHRQSARQHKRWHQGTRYQCPHCAESFVKLSSYFTHRRIKHPTDFVCQLCGFSFLSEKGIAQHKQLKHRLLDLTIPEDGPLCELCNIRFVNEEALNQHLLVSPKHPDKESLVRNTPKFKRIVTCEKCGIKNEGVRAHLNHFKESHPGENSTQRGRPLMCKLCGLNFEGTRAYLSHMRQTHPGHVSTPTPCGVKKDVECELCGVHSEGTRGYLTHFRQTHPGEAPKQCAKRKHIMCELCGKMFQFTAQLRQHSLIHTERGFKCEICDKTFTTKTFLMNHRKRHTDLTTYPCTLCGKHFSHDTNRRRHMLIHKNIRPYKCDICDKAFIMPCDRRAHIEHSHNKKPWPKRNPMRPRRQVTKQPAAKVERLPEIKMDEE